MISKDKTYHWADVEQIVDKYSTMLLRLAYSHVGNMEDAEDIIQDVFIKFAGQPIFKSEEHKKAWLIRVTINQCINLSKSSHKTKTAELDFDIPQEEKETQDLIPYLMKLPDKYKSVLYLYYYEEYSVDYISDLLKKRPSSIYTLLDRGRKQLKILLEKEGY